MSLTEAILSAALLATSNTAPVEAADSSPTFTEPTIEVSGRRSRTSLPKWLDRSLAEAFETAADRLVESPECRALFEPYSGDGSALLERTVYRSPATHREREVCRHASAFTTVGSAVTRLCRSFSRLPPNLAAVVLIHEALHFGGMPESESGKGAMTSLQINQTVAQECDL